jgi:hypothetical protein
MKQSSTTRTAKNVAQGKSAMKAMIVARSSGTKAMANKKKTISSMAARVSVFKEKAMSEKNKAKSLQEQAKLKLSEAREKAKAAALREKEKARAAAIKQKERAKAAALKEKEKVKAAAAKERERAAREEAKALAREEKDKRKAEALEEKDVEDAIRKVAKFEAEEAQTRSKEEQPQVVASKVSSGKELSSDDTSYDEPIAVNSHDAATLLNIAKGIVAKRAEEKLIHADDAESHLEVA